VFVATEQDKPCRQRSTGARATDADPLGVDTELLGVFNQPLQRQGDVLQAGGIRKLRRETIVDRHDHHVDVGGVVEAPIMLELQVAKDEGPPRG
jgi:hypothetical protein